MNGVYLRTQVLIRSLFVKRNVNADAFEDLHYRFVWVVKNRKLVRAELLQRPFRKHPRQHDTQEWIAFAERLCKRDDRSVNLLRLFLECLVYLLHAVSINAFGAPSTSSEPPLSRT